MNHGFKLHPDGTLEIIMPKGVKVGRVFVLEAGTQNGGLYYPSEEPKIIRCKDCKHWRQQTNYNKAPLSFGFCESDNMWRSLYGETYEVSHIDTDDDFYCGYAERRIDDGE